MDIEDLMKSSVIRHAEHGTAVSMKQFSTVNEALGTKMTLIGYPCTISNKNLSKLRGLNSIFDFVFRVRKIANFG